MHIRHSTKLTKLVVVGGLLWLAILLLLTMTDFATRGILGVAWKVSGAGAFACQPSCPSSSYCSLVAALAALIFSTSASCDLTLGASSAVGANFRYALKCSAAPA